MANTREIQSRMKSIQDTMKITNAMYMISSTKLRKAKKNLEETEPYFYTLQTMVSRIVRHLPEIDNKYFDERKDKPAEEKTTGLVVTADLHSLGQMIQQGQRNLFETIVRFAPPRKRTTIEVDWKNLDGLNYLEGKTLDFVEEQAFQGTLSAHVDGGVPNIVLQTDEVDADTLGELFYFFELSCGISAYMLGVNPFNQPGVEFYKKNMFHLLGKPGY